MGPLLHHPCKTSSEEFCEKEQYAIGSSLLRTCTACKADWTQHRGDLFTTTAAAAAVFFACHA
jgi:hypothetical protein